MADSVPVAVASDQSAIPTSSSSDAVYGTDTFIEGTTSGQPIAVRKDTLASLVDTDNELTVLQVNGSGALYIDGSDTTQPISAASLPLPTGAATESTLSTLDGKVPSQGQALMAASVPVVIASDQSNLPIGSGVLESTNNTTTTPLGSGATYTGTIEQNDYNDVIVSCQTDNSGTLYFDFSVDGTNITTFPVNGFDVASGIHEFHTALKGPRWFRVRLVNDAGAQSYLRLYTYYGAFSKIPNAPLNQSIVSDSDAIISRSVITGQVQGGTAFANVKIDNSTDANLSVSLQNPLTAFGELKTASSKPEVQLSFIYGISSLLTTTDHSGFGSATATNSLLSVSSGASTSSAGILYSKRYIKYRTGQGSNFKGTCIFDTGTADNTQLLGVGDDNNGYFFGYNGTSFGILRRSGGIDNWTAQASWNYDVMDGTGDSGMTLNPQNGNVYSIAYQWLGFGAIYFYIENEINGKLTLVHMIKYANNNTAPSILQPALPIRVSSENGLTNSTDIIIKSSSLAGFNEGDPALLGKEFSVESTGITGVTTEVPVLSLHVKTSLNGITAYIPVLPFEVTAVGEGTGSNVVKFNIYKNPLTLTTTSYTDVNGTESVVEYDTAATSFSGGDKIGSYVVERNRGLILNLKDRNIELNSDDTLTITCESASSVAPDVAIVWLENDSH